jgi:hypothetical protein
MVSKSRKQWQAMTPAERRERIGEILAILESRRQSEPVPKTTGEWWESAGYLQTATLFAYSMLGGRVED